MQWFRWYQGTCEDTKFRVTASHANVTVCHIIAVWAALLEDASKAEHRGICERDEDYIAASLGLDAPTVQGILEAMQDLDLISVGIGAITVIHWKERQFEIDAKDPTATERQRRKRAKDRLATTSSRQSHAVVTPESLPETDTDTDKKDITPNSPEEDLTAIPPSLNRMKAEFEIWYATYPHKIGRGQALKAYKTARKKTSQAKLMAGVVAYRFNKPAYADWCQPATWLNGERWLDDVKSGDDAEFKKQIDAIVARGASSGASR